jgi:AbrB family looped-hinge helix DNA binding protein
MSYIVSITSQGQISIPAKIRRELGLTKKKRAFVSVEKGKVVIEPVRDILELAGSIKTNKRPLSNDELHDIVAEAIAEEYVASMKRSK